MRMTEYHYRKVGEARAALAEAEARGAGFLELGDLTDAVEDAEAARAKYLKHYDYDPA
jgi:hypothetical protein